MSEPIGFTARKARFLNRLHARLATRARAATAFVSSPEPKTIGSYARGRQLSAGNYLFAGHLIAAPDVGLWDLTVPDAAFSDELHGFAWLDDLAAVGDIARAKRRSVAVGLDRPFRSRLGPGWTPDLTGGG